METETIEENIVRVVVPFYDLVEDKTLVRMYPPLVYSLFERTLLGTPTTTTADAYPELAPADENDDLEQIAKEILKGTAKMMSTVSVNYDYTLYYFSLELFTDGEMYLYFSKEPPILQ